MAGILRMVGKFFEWTFDIADWLLLNEKEVWDMLDKECEEGEVARTYAGGYMFEFSRNDGIIVMEKFYWKSFIGMGWTKISYRTEGREGWRTRGGYDEEEEEEEE